MATAALNAGVVGGLASTSAAGPVGRQAAARSKQETFVCSARPGAGAVTGQEVGSWPSSTPAGSTFSAASSNSREARKPCQPPQALAVAPAIQAEVVDWDELAKKLDKASPLEILDKALELFGDDIAIAFSGAEDVALIEYAHMTGRPYRVFSLDTGRLNPETYQFFAEVEKKYGIKIEYTFPESQEVEKLVREKGLFSFYEDGHQECCRIRKVRPLRKQLMKLRAWITGQRKDQSPGTRSFVPIVQVDPAFEGLDGGPGSLIKFNPLSNVKGTDLWNFLRVMEVPVNSLHSKGYVSIGCEPCTRAVLPGQHEREGRWWWEDATDKECGLHKGNLDLAKQAENGAAASNGAAAKVTRDLYAGVDAVVQLQHADMVSLLQNAGQRQASTLVVLYAPWCRFCQAMEEDYTRLAQMLQGSNVRVAKFQADGDEKPFAQKELGMKSFPTIMLFPKNGSGFVTYPSERRDVESLMQFVVALCGLNDTRSTNAGSGI